MPFIDVLKKRSERKKNFLSNSKLNLFSLAKYINREIYLESWLRSKGIYQLPILEKYSVNQNILKIKVLIYKIIYALVFGILPFVPIFSYIRTIETLLIFDVSIDKIILLGGIIFSLFFGLQFFNFFLMGLLESGIIFSGKHFKWFETFPIPRDKLRKLSFLTLFRTFDIPIVVIILASPITLFIFTESILVFFVSLIVSILNLIFSFDIVIIFGERLNRISNFNEISSKGGFTIQVIHNLSHVIIILGGIYMIQWLLFSLDNFVNIIIEINDISKLITVISMIPYPINPSCLISFFIMNKQMPMVFCINMFIGLIIFICLTCLIHLQASKSLERTTYSKFKEIKRGIKADTFTEEPQVKIKTRSPTIAYLRKDLSIALRDLKSFSAMITPIVFSCLFIFFFNITSIEEEFLIERDYFSNFICLLIIFPVISIMIVNGIINIETSGESILASLPINYRQRAKAKIILLIFLQTLAVFCPVLLFISSDKFLGLLLTVITCLPLSWFFILLTFNLRILFFSKFRSYYVIEEVNPESRYQKWGLIIGIQYLVSFGIIFCFIVSFVYEEFLNLIYYFLSGSIIGLFFIILLLNTIFPHIPKLKTLPNFKPEFIKEVKITYFSNNPGKTLLILIALYFGTIYLLRFLIQSFLPYYYYFYYIDWWLIFLILSIYNLSSIVVFIIIITKIVKLQTEVHPIPQYLAGFKIGWPKTRLKYFFWILLVPFFVFSIIYSLFLALRIQIPFIFIDYYEIFNVGLIFSNIFWQEIFFHGIILTIFLEIYNAKKAILFDSLLFSLFSSITLVFLIFFENPSYMPFSYLVILLFLYAGIIVPIIFTISSLFAYLSFKANSVLPAIVLQYILYLTFLTNLPLYSLIFQFFFLPQVVLFPIYY
ncbi:MAG: hypothetical protein ACFFCE_05435 [Promethearchaeota archaeon]